jgi:hypothetical protein
LTIKLVGDDLQIFYGEEQVATHRLSHQKGQMITDQKHFVGIPRPAYPTGVRAIRETFLSHFPKTNPFLDGLVKAKYGNARYHIQEILSLLEDYPQEVVGSAIDRATEYSAFDCSTVRNICRQKEPLMHHAGHLMEMSLSPRTPLISETVEERALSYYSELE